MKPGPVVELKALREEASTPYEVRLVNVLSDLYGLLSVQQMQLRLLADPEEGAE